MFIYHSYVSNFEDNTSTAGIGSDVNFMRNESRGVELLPYLLSNKRKKVEISTSCIDENQNHLLLLTNYTYSLY